QRWRKWPGGAPTGNITLVSVLDGQPTYLTRAHGYKPSHGGRLPINLGSKNGLPGSHTSAGWPATGGAASSPQKERKTRKRCICGGCVTCLIQQVRSPLSAPPTGIAHGRCYAHRFATHNPR